MSSGAVPWYVRAVIGTGAWVTAVVLMVLGGAFVFALLKLDDPLAIAPLGGAYMVFGVAMLRGSGVGLFGEQLGLAAAAAGAAMVAGGIATGSEALWAGFLVAAVMTGIVAAATQDKILQFLVAFMASGFYVAMLLEMRSPYVLDYAALLTPVGLLLLLVPPRRDLMPTAVALLLTFPLVSALPMDFGPILPTAGYGGTVARILHILLFLGLATIHWRRTADEGARMRTLGVAIIATVVCLLLPPGGSAAMLLLMLAFVIGSRPFAVVGALLQVQFIIRYYYSLEMNLLNKSLLLMGVGVLLIFAWWIMQRATTRSAAQ